VYLLWHIILFTLAESLSSYADDYKQLHQEFELEKVAIPVPEKAILTNSEFLAPKHEFFGFDDPTRVLTTGFKDFGKGDIHLCV